jgi:hypothetical protein
MLRQERLTIATRTTASEPSLKQEGTGLSALHPLGAAFARPVSIPASKFGYGAIPKKWVAPYAFH